jgi:hypothetical protein
VILLNHVIQVLVGQDERFERIAIFANRALGPVFERHGYQFIPGFCHVSSGRDATFKPCFAINAPA